MPVATLLLSLLSPLSPLPSPLPWCFSLECRQLTDWRLKVQTSLAFPIGTLASGRHAPPGRVRLDFSKQTAGPCLAPKS
jgi:hypothetical protein